MDLRETLTKLGWAQGALINGHALDPSFPHDLYLIISQTCDILHKDPGIEPNVELLGLTRLSLAEVRAELKNGRNPREIHFELADDGNGSQWLHTSMQDICFLDRKSLQDPNIKANLMVPPAVLTDLIRWRANRYLRPAFPDQFEKVLRHDRKSEKLKRKITREKDLIEQIHVAIDPLDELPPGEDYVIDFLLLIEPETFLKNENRTKLKTLCEEIETLYQKTPGLEELTCRFLPLDKVTLYQIRDYLRWSPHDHLSFGDPNF